MLSPQDWVEVRGTGERERREAHGRRSGGSPPENFEKFIAGNAFSRHFRHFLVTFLKEWVIPRKRRRELDSDPKMNQTERRLPLPVNEQSRSVVARSSEST